MDFFNDYRTFTENRARIFTSRLAGGLLLMVSGAEAPAQELYRLNPGDKIEISVWQEENLKSEIVVLPDGVVSFPLIGHIPAAGKTTEEFTGILKKRLSTYIPDPEVNVRLISAAGNKIYVTGEVKRPGAFEAARPMDVMQAISMAEGLTEFAKRNGIIVLRRDAEGRVKSFSFEYDEVESGEQLESNIVLQAGDTVVVP